MHAQTCAEILRSSAQGNGPVSGDAQARQWWERSECGARQQHFFNIFTPLEPAVAIAARQRNAALQ